MLSIPLQLVPYLHRGVVAVLYVHGGHDLADVRRVALLEVLVKGVGHVHAHGHAGQLQLGRYLHLMACPPERLPVSRGNPSPNKP
eukprot:288281-Prorocentrum_minimum.AAC.1